MGCNFSKCSDSPGSCLPAKQRPGEWLSFLVFCCFFFLSVVLTDCCRFVCLTLVRKYPDLPGSRWEWGLCCDSRGSEVVRGHGQRWTVRVLPPLRHLGVHSLGSEQWPCAADLSDPGWICSFTGTISRAHRMAAVPKPG